MIETLSDIARNKDFLRLHRELNKFNIFHATGMKNQEIKHTQFLGYLLDPNESHGLKEEFLLRFIQSLPKQATGSACNINLLDFNLSYARVIKEKTFEKNENRLDLLIEIPSLDSPSKIYIIAIENKIRATAAENQLERYENSITSSYREVIKDKPILLYLSINEDSIANKSWTPILYSDTIIHAINNLVSDLHETLSDYMIFILKDYIEFINHEGEYESNNNLEEIVLQMGSPIIKRIKEILSEKNNPIEEQRLSTRYKKVLDHLAPYDTDPRVEILRYFKDQFDGNGIYKTNSCFRLETSNRIWMRFSFLEEEVGQKLSNICENPTRRWLKSQRHLAFEFIFNESEGSDQVNCRVTLVLGPTGIDYEQREELLQNIRGIFAKSHTGTSIDTGVNDHFDAIRRGGYSKYNARNLTANDAKKWIEETLVKISKDEEEFIKGINDFIKNL